MLVMVGVRTEAHIFRSQVGIGSESDCLLGQLKRILEKNESASKLLYAAYSKSYVRNRLPIGTKMPWPLFRGCINYLGYVNHGVTFDVEYLENR